MNGPASKFQGGQQQVNPLPQQTKRTKKQQQSISNGSDVIDSLSDSCFASITQLPFPSNNSHAQLPDTMSHYDNVLCFPTSITSNMTCSFFNLLKLDSQAKASTGMINFDLAGMNSVLSTASDDRNNHSSNMNTVQCMYYYRGILVCGDSNGLLNVYDLTHEQQRSHIHKEHGNMVADQILLKKMMSKQQEQEQQQLQQGNNNTSKNNKNKNNNKQQQQQQQVSLLSLVNDQSVNSVLKNDKKQIIEEQLKVKIPFKPIIQQQNVHQQQREQHHHPLLIYSLNMGNLKNRTRTMNNQILMIDEPHVDVDGNSNSSNKSTSNAKAILVIVARNDNTCEVLRIIHKNNYKQDNKNNNTKQLLLGNINNNCSSFMVTNYQQIKSGPLYSVNHISISNDGLLLACSNSDGYCYMHEWNSKTGKYSDNTSTSGSSSKNSRYFNGHASSSINSDKTLICTYNGSITSIYELNNDNNNTFSYSSNNNNSNNDKYEGIIATIEAPRSNYNTKYKLCKFMPKHSNLLCITRDDGITIYNICNRGNKDYHITSTTIMFPTLSEEEYKKLVYVQMQQQYGNDALHYEQKSQHQQQHEEIDKYPDFQYLKSFESYYNRLIVPINKYQPMCTMESTVQV